MMPVWVILVTQHLPSLLLSSPLLLVLSTSYLRFSVKKRVTAAPSSDSSSDSSAEPLTVADPATVPAIAAEPSAGSDSTAVPATVADTPDVPSSIPPSGTDSTAVPVTAANTPDVPSSLVLSPPSGAPHDADADVASSVVVLELSQSSAVVPAPPPAPSDFVIPDDVAAVLRSCYSSEAIVNYENGTFTVLDWGKFHRRIITEDTATIEQYRELFYEDYPYRLAKMSDFPAGHSPLPADIVLDPATPPAEFPPSPDVPVPCWLSC